jgi:fluoride exporter
VRPELDRREVAAIFAGGFLGATARAAVVEFLGRPPGDWPWATLLVNLLGALVLGWVLTRFPPGAALGRYRRPFLAAGFCGALTTFSTLQIELVQMIDRGAWGLAAGYTAVSLTGGLLAVHAGIRLVRRSGRPA